MSVPHRPAITPSAPDLMIVARRLSSAVLAAFLVLAVMAARASALDNTYWCTVHAPPCVISASLDGAPLLATDPTYDVWAISGPPAGGATTIDVSIQRVNPLTGGDLGAGALGHTFSVTVDTGTVVPRSITSFGDAMTYTRTPLGGGTYDVTVTGQPTTVTNGGCSYPEFSPPSCTPVAPSVYTALFDTQIDDYAYSHYSPGDIASFYGMDMYTNINETGLPPQINPDPSIPGSNEIIIQLADHHFMPDGATLVHGFLHLVLPPGLLMTYYGINDPTTLTADGLTASIGAGTATITVEPGGAVGVDLTGVTFSHRKLVLRRGVVTPSRPTHLRARRLSALRGRVSFTPARPRGQRIRGYLLTCRASTGATLSAAGGRSPLAIAGLRAGRAYGCTVRARSRAGYGNRSAKVRLPA